VSHGYTAAVGSRDNPLTAAAPKEIPLPDAPLISVICRINFPDVVSIAKSDFIAPFQESLRSAYPVLRPEQTMGFLISAALPGASAPPPQTTWRFSDTKGTWRVSLATSFLALETTAYESRKDFVDRLRIVVDALAQHVNPQVVDRIGLRYIDRITGEPVKNMEKYVRPEVLGVLSNGAAKTLRHSMTESVFDVPNSQAQLLARWGQLPANATTDPAAIRPIDKPSWILDLDMFSANSRPFNAKAVIKEVDSYAERIYTFFRWAVTSDFLKLFGGRV
jgi:uncharacterized protein (TIGR04255 family)